MTDHIAPANSRVFKRFLEIAESSDEIDRIELLDVLHKINAPSDLRAFNYLAHRMADFFESNRWQDQSQTPDHKFLVKLADVFRWARTLDVTQISAEIFETYREQPVQGVGRNPLLNKGIKRHPAYAAMFETHVNKDHRTAWNRLLLHYMAAHARLVNDFVPLQIYLDHDKPGRIPDIPCDPYPANHALRTLSSDDAGQELDLLLPDCTHELAESACELIERYADSHPKMALIIKFIGRAYGHIEFSSGRKTSGGGTGHGSNAHGYIDPAFSGAMTTSTTKPDKNDPEGNRGQFGVQSGSLIPSGDMPGYIRSDVHPWDLINPKALLSITPECKKGSKSAAAAVLAAKGAEGQIVLDAQYLPFAYSGLTQAEVVALHNAVFDHAMHCLAVTSTSVDDELAATLIVLIMFWVGCEYESAIDARMLTRKVKTSPAHVGLYAVASGFQSQFEWRKKAIFPSYTGAPTLSPEHSRQRREAVWLPDIANIGKLILRYRERPLNSGRDRGHIFGREVPSPKFIEGVLSELVPGSRISLSKISNYVLQRVSSYTQDITAAALLASRQVDRAQSRMYYTLVTNDHLRKQYCDALKADHAALGISQTDFAEARSRSTGDWYVGARQCVKSSSFQRGTAGVIEELERLQHYDDWDGLVAYHNLFTAYCIWSFCFATCLRAISNPYVPHHEFDSETGISTFRDKDSDPPYHAKFIWLPQNGLKQNKIYDQHAQRMLAELTIRGVTSQPHGPCFFVSATRYKPQKVRPSTWEKLVRPYLPAPANAHRRFIRTELLECGCPIETIDALLGHWFLGEEPWAPESSFDWQHHVELLKKFHVPLIEETGFRVMNSALLGRTSND